MQLNLNVPFYLTQQCLPMLEAAQTEGSPSSVINIGSIDGMQRSLAVSSNRHVGVLYIHSAAIIHRNSAIIQSAISLSQ